MRLCLHITLLFVYNTFIIAYNKNISNDDIIICDKFWCHCIGYLFSDIKIYCIIYIMLDKFIILSIAIVLNMFVHHMSSVLYKDLPFEKKSKNNAMFLLVLGIFGIILSKLLINNKIISNGVLYGSVLIEITVLFMYWTNSTDEMKLILSGLVFIGLLYFVREKMDNIKNDSHHTQ